MKFTALFTACLLSVAAAQTVSSSFSSCLRPILDDCDNKNDLTSSRRIYTTA
jgi:hypothetical protein